jgi:hypothetical protein
MSELKPCPFCGWNYAESAWNEFGDQYWVCDQCGATSGTVNSMWDWNTRPIEDALNARIEELEHDLINKEIEYTDLWDDALAFQSRIAELEAFIDQLIEVGDAVINAEPMWIAEEDKWETLVKDWKERKE